MSRTPGESFDPNSSKTPIGTNTTRNDQTDIGDNKDAPYELSLIHI